MLISSERKNFLEGRLRDAARAQPEIRKLRDVLIRLGGQLLVPPLEWDDFVPDLIEQGFLFFGAIDFRAGRPSQCHRNVARLWIARRRGLVAIGVGYALSPDGLWRQHAWGIARDRLIETTVPRVAYFGVPLVGSRAARYAASNTAGSTGSRLRS